VLQHHAVRRDLYRTLNSGLVAIVDGAHHLHALLCDREALGVGSRSYPDGAALGHDAQGLGDRLERVGVRPVAAGAYVAVDVDEVARVHARLESDGDGVLLTGAHGERQARLAVLGWEAAL